MQVRGSRTGGSGYVSVNSPTLSIAAVLARPIHEDEVVSRETAQDSLVERADASEPYPDDAKAVTNGTPPASDSEAAYASLGAPEIYADSHRCSQRDRCSNKNKL